jgi:hypothetical protein
VLPGTLALMVAPEGDLRRQFHDADWAAILTSDKFSNAAAHNGSGIGNFLAASDANLQNVHSVVADQLVRQG